MSYENTFKRKEMKYMLSTQTLAAIKHAMRGHMQEDDYGLSTISNIYCDSPDDVLVRRSMEKPVYKEKLRLRSYGACSPQDTVYLELKKKFDGVVYKRRLPLRLEEAMAYLDHGVYPQQDSQVLREIDYAVRTWNLAPKLFVEYDRIAFFGVEDKEFRMTFDFNIRSRAHALRFDSHAPCTPLATRPYALLEVKAAQAMPEWLTRTLSTYAIYPVSFSKIGRVYTQRMTQEQKKEKALCLKAS